MYFASRVQAGRMLASKLDSKYQTLPCTVVAMGDGGVMVGAQIAKKLRCPLTLLMNAEINLPREPQAIAGITSGGVLTYNHAYSQGELDEMVGEYYGFIEAEKLTQMHALNQLVGPGGTISKHLLKHRNIILVSDGLKTGFELDIAAEFLKPIDIQKMIVAVPFASLQAVDKMHILADDLYCLSVITDYFDTEHYYDVNDVPDHETVLKTIEELVAKWS
jgi:putative phosphoribosyl transferase